MSFFFFSFWYGAQIGVFTHDFCSRCFTCAYLRSEHEVKQNWKVRQQGRLFHAYLHRLWTRTHMPPLWRWSPWLTTPFHRKAVEIQYPFLSVGFAHNDRKGIWSIYFCWQQVFPLKLRPILPNLTKLEGFLWQAISWLIYQENTSLLLIKILTKSVEPSFQSAWPILWHSLSGNAGW